MNEVLQLATAVVLLLTTTTLIRSLGVVVFLTGVVSALIKERGEGGKGVH